MKKLTFFKPTFNTTFLLFALALFSVSCASMKHKANAETSDPENGALFAFVKFAPANTNDVACKIRFENDATKKIAEMTVEPKDPPVALLNLPAGTYHATDSDCGAEATNLWKHFPDGVLVVPKSLGFLGNFTVVLNDKRIVGLRKPPSAESWDTLRKYQKIIPSYPGGLVSGFNGWPINL